MSSRKIALITGISGQDGSYLAQLLLRKNYEVYGSSRDINVARFESLHRLKIFGRVKLISMPLHDSKSTAMVISKLRPTEIYHLAGQSSVAFSFDKPLETFESLTLGTVNILEALRCLGMPTKLYHASSGECFGDTGEIAADELTPFNPVSPYGIAKSAAHSLIKLYREAYRIYASNGILFNHESELRPARFVTQKIVQSAYRISCGSKEKLNLGNLNIIRDWGWAPEYVEAMWRTLQLIEPEDYIIATGEANSLKDFVDLSFSSFGLDWAAHVQFDEKLTRPCEIRKNQANPDKALQKLGWKATKHMKDVIQILVSSQKISSSIPNRSAY